MNLRLQHVPDPASFARMRTREIPQCFLLRHLFEP